LFVIYFEGRKRLFLSKFVGPRAFEAAGRWL